MESQQEFSLKAYLTYKFLNSLFVGTALGTIFTIYALIPPKVYSLGGVSLSVVAWLLTLLYVKLISIKPYKRILLFIEILPFCYILAFLLFPNTFYGALFIYGIYQISFILEIISCGVKHLSFHKKHFSPLLINISKQAIY